MWYGHVLRRRICGQESDGDAGAGEKKTEADVVGQHQERLVGERSVSGKGCGRSVFDRVRSLLLGYSGSL